MKVMAVASGGGHWKQLMLLRESFGENAFYVTTVKGLPEESGLDNFAIVPDASKKEPFKVLLLLFRMTLIILKHRPRLIVSTGAAPGLLAISAGRLVGSKSIWIDSVANGDELSLGGRLAKKLATKTLSQWENVAEEYGVEFKGRVL